MHPSRNVLLFRGSRNGEELLINKEYYKLNTAQIICSILMLDESFFHHLDELYELLKTIEKDYQHNKPPALMEQQEYYRGYIERIRTTVMETIDKGNSKPEQLLLRLAVYLPCYEAYAPSYASMERMRVKQPFLDDVIRSDIDDPVRKVNERFDKLLNIHGTLYAGWNQFINYLSNPGDNFIFQIMADVIFGKNLNVSRTYSDRFDFVKLELRRLKIDLNCAFSDNNEQVLFELKNGIPGPRIYSYNEFVFPEAETKIDKYNKVLEFVSFSELIVVELNLLDDINRAPRR